MLEKEVWLEFRHTTKYGAIESKTQIVTVKYYNLDVIISVGYRVKSLRGTGSENGQHNACENISSYPNEKYYLT